MGSHRIARVLSVMPRLGSSLRFTLAQAAMSTLAALALGFPGAWLYARYRFPGRAALMALSALPFCVPPLLVILAFVLHLGNAGSMTVFLRSIGLIDGQSPSILYSFGGIVLIHAFYNFPIIIQIVGSTWSRLPGSREEAARSLGAKSLRAFSVGTLPSLLPAILQASGLVFLFCYFSFTIVLVFGGRIGSTPEVEIYRLLRFEADPAAALAVAMPETAIALFCLLFMASMERRAHPGGADAGASKIPSRLRGKSLILAAVYALIVVLCFLGPLVSLVWRAFEPGKGSQAQTSAFLRLLTLPGSPLYPAILDTLATAFPAALLATTAGTIVARIRKAGIEPKSPSRMLDTVASLPMAISQVLMAFGWGLLFPAGGILPIVLAQACSAFPFVYRSMAGVFASLDAGPLLAARTLGASPLQRFLWIELPMSLPVFMASGAFAFAMAAGDVNAALVLGTGRFQNLPLLLYRLVGAYRFGEACAVGLILALLCAVVFLFKENLPDGA